jgi:hypothetical protein
MSPKKSLFPADSGGFFGNGVIFKAMFLGLEHPHCSNGSNAKTRICSFHNLLV